MRPGKVEMSCQTTLSTDDKNEQAQVLHNDHAYQTEWTINFISEAENSPEKGCELNPLGNASQGETPFEEGDTSAEEAPATKTQHPSIWSKTAVFSVFVLLCLLAPMVQAPNLLYQTCSHQENGMFFEIPRGVVCNLPPDQPVIAFWARLWFPNHQAVTTDALCCTALRHTKPLPIDARLCVRMARSQYYRGSLLHQLKPNLWATKNVLHVTYHYCCTDYCTTVDNAVV
jgi:hypothetical protein